MMRKLGMNRSSKVGGAKKVVPPSVPGSNPQQVGNDSIYMEYDSMSVYEGRLELGLGDTLDKSYDSTNSEGGLRILILAYIQNVLGKTLQ